MTLSDPNPIHGPPEITSILKFWDPVISLEEVKIGISVLVCSRYLAAAISHHKPPIVAISRRQLVIFVAAPVYHQAAASLFLIVRT